MTTARAATVWIPGLAAACWALTVRQMSGMDMGTSSELGSFSFFAALWVSMMAAMMLPGAVPAVARAGRGLAGPLFAASYVGVWALFGLAVYALYRPHGVAAAGALTIGAGLYELTPLKRECRRRCRRDVRSGFQFGVYCVGSSVGLMVMLVAASVPLSFANVWNETAVLTLLQPTGFLSAASLQRESLAMMFLTLHMDGIRLAAIFWGLWLFPFGVLVMRSGFLPKIFGVLLILACLGWVADTLVWILAPQYSNAMDMAANVIGGFGGIPISLWLLVVGVSNRRNSTSRL